MKNFNQLMEDIRSDEALAKAVSLAMEDYVKTRDKAPVIAMLAGKGYEIDERELDPAQPANTGAPQSDFTSLHDEDLEAVAGGMQATQDHCNCGSKYLRRTGYYRKGVVFRTLWPDTEYFCTKCRNLFYWTSEYTFYPMMTDAELQQYDLVRPDGDNYLAVYKG